MAADFGQRGVRLFGEKPKDGPFCVANELEVDREKKADRSVVSYILDCLVEAATIKGSTAEELDLVGMVAALPADSLDLVIAEART